ncbi:hypothetical protein PMAYCL1PPCAC_33181, partial [Pristionchus mayeri]
VPADDMRKCFRRVPQVTINGRADDIYQNISSSDCLEKCRECDDLPCLSVIYYDDVSECVLLRLNEEEGSSIVSPIQETVSTFWRDEACNGNHKCSPHMDLVVLLDGSDSIGIEAFRKGLRVVQKLLHSIRQFTNDVRMSVVQTLFSRSLLGQTASTVIRKNRSPTSIFLLISDLFIEDNVGLIDRELNKSIRTMITLSLTESFDRKVGERLTMGDNKMMIHSSEDDKAGKQLIQLLCAEGVRRVKREGRLLDSRRVWIGLKMTDEGRLQWIDHSTISRPSRLSDSMSDEKKCVSSEMEWNYTDCKVELPFVCAFTPLEKL